MYLKMKFIPVKCFNLWCNSYRQLARILDSKYAVIVLVIDTISLILFQSSICAGLYDEWYVYVLQTGRIPQQYLLEAKFLSGQPVYRFRLENEGDFTINFQPGAQQMKSLKNGSLWEIRRRPLFLQPSMMQPYVNHASLIIFGCNFS